MRNRLIFIVTVLIAGVASRPLGAQITVRGRLVDGVAKSPVIGALAELRDQQANVIAQTFTSPTGAFLFAVPGNKKYVLRIAAIGYGRHAPIEIPVGTETVVVPDVVLTPVVVTLPELHAMSGKRACGKSEVNPETFGGLLESARTSLQVMDATLRSGSVAFEMQVIHKLAVKTSTDSSISADTVGGVLHEWPVKSLSIDSLQELGFQRPKTPEEGFGHHYYGPDMQVLVSDWFLDTHCFALDKDRSKGDTVVIKFDPAGKNKNTDVSGTLVLDRSSLTMRRLTFELRDLPDGVPDRSAGGEMRFAEKSPGLWVPIEWAIWAPITKSARTISRPVLTTNSPGQRVVVAGGRGSMMGGSSNLPPPPPPLVQVVGRDERRGRLTRMVPLGGS